jgi:hypothetical protein
MWTTHAMQSDDFEDEKEAERGRSIVLPDRNGLTKKQTEFLAFYTSCAFLPMKEICRQAGVTPSQVAQWKLKSPAFRRQLDIEHNRTQQAAGMDRKQVLQGILEAIEIAKDMRQPSSMISGWREVGRMCGFYEPERREITLSVDKKELMKELRNMSTHDLLEYASRKDAEDNALEAEFEIVEDT